MANNDANNSTRHVVQLTARFVAKELMPGAV
jgi:hypothetical protein